MKLLFSFILLIISASVFAENAEVEAAPTEINVYRSPDCHCCHRWIEHLQQNHFKVIDHVTQNMVDVKQKLGMPSALASCHTATVNGYLIEGHVPANDILRLIKEKPAIKGLSVPQMPVGTPGMEVAQRKDNFSVISFDAQNHYAVYNRYQVGEDHQYHADHD